MDLESLIKESVLFSEGEKRSWLQRLSKMTLEEKDQLNELLSFLGKRQKSAAAEAGKIKRLMEKAMLAHQKLGNKTLKKALLQNMEAMENENVE